MNRFVALAICSLAIAGTAAAQSEDSAPAPATTSAADTEAAPAATPPAPTAAPEAVTAAPPAERWTSHIYTWGGVGTTFAFGEVYGSLNAGAGYLMKYGLAPNLELSYNFGAEPTLWTVRPGVTWYMPVPRFYPYIGAYYTHWFVSGGRADENGVGARAGVSLGRVLSVAVTYDHALDCKKDCDIWTPQVAAGMSF